MSKQRKPHYDRNKNPAFRFSAINRLMGAQIAKQPMAESDIEQIELPVLAAIECIAKGHGTIAHWNELAHAINQSWILCTEKGIGEEAKPYLLSAQDAMKRIAKRFRETGRLAFDAAGLQAIRLAAEIFSSQLALCSFGEVYDAGEVADKHFRKTPEAS